MNDDQSVSDLVRLPVERAMVFRLLGKGRALPVLEKLDPSQQAELIYFSIARIALGI